MNVGNTVNTRQRVAYSLALASCFMAAIGGAQRGRWILETTRPRPPVKSVHRPLPSADIERSHATKRIDSTLIGVRIVTVVVEHMSDEAIRAGLDSSTVMTRAEVGLRKGGLRVVPASSAAWNGFFYIRVQTISNYPGTISYCISAEFHQLVTASLNRKTVFASTWASSSLLGGQKIADFPQVALTDVDEVVDQYLNVWLEANPRR